jgi:hypothetical protein
VECKSVRKTTYLDQAQIINYLKISDKRVGLLINFNVLRLKDGLKRYVNNYIEDVQVIENITSQRSWRAWRFWVRINRMIRIIEF